MRFNPKARLDTSRVRDRGRGSRGRGGSPGGSTGGPGGPGGLPLSPGALGGGGLGLVVVVVLVVLVTQLGGGGADTATDAGSSTERYAACLDGADANESTDCTTVAVENSLTDFWGDLLGARFRPERELVTFTDSVQTGCGPATSAVGPFYCPGDETIYLDTDFFDDVLERQLGGPDGGFVVPYVLAHEYGHHVQALLGTMADVETREGPTSDAVRLELQADCYAGMWARAATGTDDDRGERLFSELTEADVREALAAAEAVGDDRIQRRTQGQVTEETWTHGSAASRARWFGTGFRDGTLRACDTFAVAGSEL